MSVGDYDVLVLGGGSAGTSAAAAAAREGARTALINDGELGGLCILRGCMPTKSLLEAAHALHGAQRLKPFGIVPGADPPQPDFPAIMARKDAHVRRFQKAKIAGIEAADYDLIRGRAAFVDRDTIDVDGQRMRAGAYVLAIGSTPSSIPIPGLEDVPVWTSDDVLLLTERPARMLVQGAGAIGLEFAQFFARMGTEVLLVNRSAPLSKHDPACGEELVRALADDGVRFAAPGRIRSLRPAGGGGLVAEIEPDGDAPYEFAADGLLMATGRHPAVDGLRLEEADVELDRGRVRHDEFLHTTNPRIWIAGDATGDHQILHLANQEGAVAGTNAAHGGPERRMDYRLKMSVIFTDPPYAEVGLSELEATVREQPVIVGRTSFPATGRAITMEVEHGTWKIQADPCTGEILGAAILGPRADDLVHEISLLMKFRGTVDDVLEAPWYHPTISEAILNVARDLKRQIRSTP